VHIELGFVHAPQVHYRSVAKQRFHLNHVLDGRDKQVLQLWQSLGRCLISRIVTVVASRGRLHGERGSAVHVADGQCATGTLHRIGFGQRFHGVAGDDVRIIGTCQRDRDGLGGAVAGFGGVAVGVGLAADQLVVGTVHGVGPHACAADTERAVAVVARDVALDLEGRRAVHIADEQRAGGDLGRFGLRQSRRADAGDDRRVVATVVG
jgi:hypothetical protein